MRVSFLCITIPAPGSVYSDDVGNSDERPYIILWCDVIILVGNLSKCLPERYEILATEVFKGLDKFETQHFSIL